MLRRRGWRLTIRPIQPRLQCQVPLFNAFWASFGHAFPHGIHLVLYGLSVHQDTLASHSVVVLALTASCFCLWLSFNSGTWVLVKLNASLVLPQRLRHSRLKGKRAIQNERTHRLRCPISILAPTYPDGLLGRNRPLIDPDLGPDKKLYNVSRPCTP